MVALVLMSTLAGRDLISSISLAFFLNLYNKDYKFEEKRGLPLKEMKVE